MPAVPGVPVTVPSMFKERSAGSDPDTSDHVRPPEPPTACSDAVYGCPVKANGSGGCGTMASGCSRGTNSSTVFTGPFSFPAMTYSFPKTSEAMDVRGPVRLPNASNSPADGLNTSAVATGIGVPSMPDWVIPPTTTTVPSGRVAETWPVRGVSINGPATEDFATGS
mgnify:CR=1 FL=1